MGKLFEALVELPLDLGESSKLLLISYYRRDGIKYKCSLVKISEITQYLKDNEHMEVDNTLKPKTPYRVTKKGIYSIRID